MSQPGMTRLTPPPGPRRGVMALFFSPFGRIGRMSFLLLMLAVIVLSVILFFLGIYLGEHGLHYSDWQIVIPAMLMLFIPAGSLAMRRLHDLGLPGWTTLLAMLPRAGWMYALSRVNIFRNDGWVEITLSLLVLDVVLLLALIFWPGQKTPNRHGPVPD
jgi:uncharacterized membrane protein YhaH (DUF805 family)